MTQAVRSSRRQLPRRASASAPRAGGTPGRVTDVHAIGNGEAELDRGVGEVAVGPGDAGGLIEHAIGVGERPG